MRRDAAGPHAVVTARATGRPRNPPPRRVTLHGPATQAQHPREQQHRGHLQPHRRIPGRPHGHAPRHPRASRTRLPGTPHLRHGGAAARSLGIEVHRGIAGTGAGRRAAQRHRPSAAIGLRADMDCLPIEETNDVAHRSHDARARCMPAAMTGTPPCCSARRDTWPRRSNFDGTVHFIFQPAEEGGGGGRVMVEEGLFDRFPCDAVYGMHNNPGLPLGEARIVAGPVLAAADRISITVHGKGGHASRPHDMHRPGAGRRADRGRRAIGDLAVDGPAGLRGDQHLPVPCRGGEQCHPRNRRTARHGPHLQARGAGHGREPGSARSSARSPRRTAPTPNCPSSVAIRRR